MTPNTSFTIVTDSASDLTESQLRAMGVISIPLNVFMKDDPAIPCKLRGTPFWNAMKEGQVACTSAANLSRFRETFSDILREGKDILYLAFSSPLSCMYATARIAAEELHEEFPDRRIILIDTRSASFGQALLVHHCAERRERGLSLDEIAAYAEATRLHVLHRITVDDLVYLKRGGRLSAASALAGSLLGIKPLLYLKDDGKLYTAGKVRGRKNAIHALARSYGEDCIDMNETAYIAQANDPEHAELLRSIMMEDYGAKHVVIGEFGPVIGAHGGPGTIALFYLGRSREP